SILLHRCRYRLDLHPCPTRRSSDLQRRTSKGCSSSSMWPASIFEKSRMSLMMPRSCSPHVRMISTNSRCSDVSSVSSRRLDIPRSEEHTSELQSRENLVCRPLLEKK